MLAEPDIAKSELIKEVEKLKAENKRFKAKVKKYKDQEKNRNAPIDSLSTYEWETLVSTWRYFEGRGTISAVMFAGNIVERFFSDDKKYTRKVKEQIARQYWYVDHGIRLEEDFAKNDDTFSWVKFLRFCEGYCNGFKNVVMKEDKKSPEVVAEAFHVDRTDRWYPVKKYLENPYVECYCEPSRIVRIYG